MKFKTLNELIKFEEEIDWKNSNSINISDYSMNNDVKRKYNSLKNEKYVGIYKNKIVTVVSEQFSKISVTDIADRCDDIFGTNYSEETHREGIIRTYNDGIENEFGTMAPLVVFPSNLGSMAVKIGLYHNAKVCSNGAILYDGKISQRIIHRLSEDMIDRKLRKVSENLGNIINLVDHSRIVEINKGVQLAMIINSLGQNNNLINQAFTKYTPKNQTLWETVQTITYVSSHETKKGYKYAVNAGNLIVNQEISPVEIVKAASYAFARKVSGENLPNSSDLFKLTGEILNKGIENIVI